MVSTASHAEELFQMRLLLEQQLLCVDLEDEPAVAGLLQQMERLQACCGQRQLTAETIASTAAALQDPDPAMRQQAASALSLQAGRSAFNRFRIAVHPGVIDDLVSLLSDEESWVRGSAAAALTHLASGGWWGMQSKIGQAPGAIPALVQMLHDTDAGLGCAAALALRTLAQHHSPNQSSIAAEPGALAGLVALALGQQQQQQVVNGALAAMAAAALRQLSAGHPVNRCRIRREVGAYCEYNECYALAGVDSGAQETRHGPKQQQQQQQQQLRHGPNQSHIAAEPGALAGLVALALGAQQQQQQQQCVVNGALAAMAAAALQQLSAGHPVNRCRIRREVAAYCEYNECYALAGVDSGAQETRHGAKQQQQQQQQLVRWQGLLAERAQQQQQHACVV
uniref:Vacuolar protein 8 n=1 Tax=Tetradesmus obliquus TaxID=3088 RepID=A0A383VBB7_TETOB|eukprot:jgi/Sobl393_1/6788/SZX62240.1